MIETRVELDIRALGYGREFMFKSAIQRIIDRGEHPLRRAYQGRARTPRADRDDQRGGDPMAT